MVVAERKPPEPARLLLITKRVISVGLNAVSQQQLPSVAQRE